MPPIVEIQEHAKGSLVIKFRRAVTFVIWDDVGFE